MRAHSRPFAWLACLLSLLLLLRFSSASSNAGWEKLGRYNQRVGAQFLQQQRLDEEVLELPTGVLYRVIDSGDGERHPTRDCQVKIHHAGKDIRGRVFEDTWRRRAPEDLTVGGVLSCWQHALERMVVGDEWEIFCPPQYAYAHLGVGVDKIGPHETLVFKLRLLAINQPEHTVPKSWVHPAHKPVDPEAIKVRHKKGKLKTEL